MATISNKVRYYTSNMAGAPVLSGTAGALIAVLDACLVNGFGNKAIDSLVVSDGIATANISSGHDFAEGDVLRISGVTPAGLNSDWRLASVTATSVVWSVEGVGIADGTATGTITALRAPAGWEKVFSDGTTRAAYRSLNYADHDGMLLCVNDTGTTSVQVRGFETMTDIDTGDVPFPTDAQLSGGGYWGKANTTTGPRAWFLVADDRRLLYGPSPISTTYGPKTFFFGRLTCAAATDTGASALTFATTAANAVSTIAGGIYGDLVYAEGQGASTLAFPRNFDGSPSPPIGGVLVAAQINNAITGFSSLPTASFLQRLPLFHPPLAHAGGDVRGAIPAVSFSFLRYDSVNNQNFTINGVPGNGLMLCYVGNIANGYGCLVNLGVVGRWE